MREEVSLIRKRVDKIWLNLCKVQKSRESQEDRKEMSCSPSWVEGEGSILQPTMISSDKIVDVDGKYNGQ
jgi:hypothetical protein